MFKLLTLSNKDIKVVNVGILILDVDIGRLLIDHSNQLDQDGVEFH